MRTSPGTRSERAMTVGDGYLGLNINPRSTGRPARLDHFGVEVDDVERVYAACASGIPRSVCSNVRRIVPSPESPRTTRRQRVRSLAKDMSNRAGVYAEAPSETHVRHVDHFTVRSIRPHELATFYRDMLELEKVPPPQAIRATISPTVASRSSSRRGTSRLRRYEHHRAVYRSHRFQGRRRRRVPRARRAACIGKPADRSLSGRQRPRGTRAPRTRRTPLRLCTTTSPIPIRSYSACGLSAPETRLTVPFDTVTVTVTVAVLLFASLNVTLAEPAASAVTMNVVAPDAGETLATVALSMRR